MTQSSIDPYRIQGEIGRGGMGVVYKALDSRLGRAIALKALPEDVAAIPERLQRFEREAKTLAALNHPNISAIYGVEEERGRRYLVLEFVDGETLTERIASEKLRLSEVLEIGAQISSALQAAHDSGIVHRDLKPDNIKFMGDGSLKVLDFGLARIESPLLDSSCHSKAQTITASEDATTPGTVVGTIGYMSPEQARGLPVDRRADLWALGVLLFECITGIHPFSRDSPVETLSSILNAEPDFDLLPANVPEEIVALIRRCLRKDSRRRLRDANDCRLLIEDALEDG